MRTSPVVLLLVGLSLSACDDGPPTDVPSTGTLVVSTSTEGDDPDQDGYLLTVDEVDSLDLDPTGTAEISLTSGQHTLRVLGVAAHCSVAPETPLEVDVPSQDTTSVAFEVNCPATGARVTVETTGPDADPNGYRITVDGTSQAVIPETGSVLARLEPGSRTIGLTDLAANCAFEGPDSRTVIIVDKEVASVEFAVVCTATSGVIGVFVSAIDGIALLAFVDGGSPVGFESSRPAYLSGVPQGDHVVSLAALDPCSVKPDSQSVTVTAGTLTRDTVEITFAVTCVTALRITAPTAGIPPNHDYSAYTCTDAYSCNYERFSVGLLGPADTLMVNTAPGTTFRVGLDRVPHNCIVSDPNPTVVIALRLGEVRDIVFHVGCSP